MSDITPAPRGARIAESIDGSFHHVPDEVIVSGSAALERLQAIERRMTKEELTGDWFLASNVRRPLAAVEMLRAEGFVAQPNHVFWTHGCRGGCPPHPAYAQQALAAIANPFSGTPFSGTPFSGTPFSGTPFSGTPFSGTPFSGTPFSGTPFSGTPFSGTKPPTSSAKPAAKSIPATRTLKGDGAHPKVRILDSGLADPRPPLLAPKNTGNATITGERDVADDQIVDANGNATGPDQFLDPIAGHGTFIAGLIELLAPGTPIHVRRILHPLGDVSEATVAAAIHKAVQGDDGANKPDIIGLSLGGPVLESPFLLASAIAHARAKGVVIVASAGNAGTCSPNYPAALQSVIAVGALGPEGPAVWSNYGDWVDACAPGVDLVSAFFPSFNGALQEVNSVDPDEFDGWAQWSGTSFSVPVVIAALAREMVTGNCDAEEAVVRVLRAPHLFRIPCFGTVVNL